MRRVLSVLLSAMLLSPQAASSAVDTAAMKERVLGIGAGSPVEVKIAGKGKVRGRMGTADDSSFALQVVKGGKVETTQVSYSDVKSLKNLSEETFGKRVGSGLVVTAIVFGVLFAVTGIVCAAGGCSN